MMDKENVRFTQTHMRTHTHTGGGRQADGHTMKYYSVIKKNKGAGWLSG